MPQRYPDMAFNPPVPQVGTVSPQMGTGSRSTASGYCPGAQNYAEGPDVGARAAGVFPALARTGLETGVNPWLCAGSKRLGMTP